MLPNICLKKKNEEGEMCLVRPPEGNSTGPHAHKVHVFVFSRFFCIPAGFFSPFFLQQKEKGIKSLSV